MNVIVANEQQNGLANLDIDIIKSITGSYDVTEIVEMFKSFFYSRMVIDVTAIKNYANLNVYQTLTSELDPNKIILLLPEGSSLCTPNFLAKIISYGIYNFTTNLNGVKYLLKKANTLEDVQKIVDMAHKKSAAPEVPTVTSGENVVSEEVVEQEQNEESIPSENSVIVVGFRNVTEHAGSTTLIHMIKKELALVYGQDSVYAIEINKSDSQLFYDKNTISVGDKDILNTIQNYSNCNYLLIDLNGYEDDSFCSQVIYLIEPSTLKLNRLVRDQSDIFNKLKDKKVILNQSLLLNNDIFDFEKEAGITIFYNMPPLDERKRNSIISDFLIKLGLVGSSPVNSNTNKIFGLFRR